MKLFARKVNSYDLFTSHSWYLPGVKGMFVLLLWYIVGAIIGSIIQMLCLLAVSPETWIKYGMLIVYPVQFIPAMIYVSSKSRMSSLFETGYKLSSSNFGGKPWWLACLVTICLTLSTIIVADLPNWLNFKLTTSTAFGSRMYDIIRQAMQTLTGGPLWSSFLVAAIFAPFFEEWLCRGMILRGLLMKMKPVWAIVISALFFAVIHGNPWQALNAFIIGLVMGYVYFKTGSLWLTMLMHFINNGLAVVLSNIESLSQYDFFIDMLGSGPYAIIYIFGIGALVAALTFFRKIPLGNAHGNIDTVKL